MNTQLATPSHKKLTSTTPIPCFAENGFHNVLVIKDDSNIEWSAREAGGKFDDQAFRNLIGWDAQIISFLVESDFEARTHKRRSAQQNLGYDVRTKRLDRIGGKFKGNVDVEISLELQGATLTPSSTDLICLLSGDGDFAPAIQVVQNSGIPVWVIAFKHSLSRHLRHQANLCIPVGQDLVLPTTKTTQPEGSLPMSNLKHLSTFCNRGWNHFQPVKMQFSRFDAPFKPVYRCPVCGKTKIFQRKHYGGPVRRVA